MQTDDVAGIAAGLTKAQRAEVLTLSADWTVRQYSTQQRPQTVWLPCSIMEQATPTQVHSSRQRLTPLGIAVRKIVEEASGK